MENKRSFVTFSPILPDDRAHEKWQIDTDDSTFKEISMAFVAKGRFLAGVATALLGLAGTAHAAAQ